MSPRATSIRALLLAGAAAAAFVPAPGWAAGAAPVATAVTPRPAFAAVPGPDAEYLSVTDRYTVRADGTVVHERDSRLQVNSSLAINRKYGETKVEWDPAIETCEVLTDRTVLPSGEVVAAPANAVVDDQPPGADAILNLRREIEPCGYCFSEKTVKTSYIFRMESQIQRIILFDDMKSFSVQYLV